MVYRIDGLGVDLYRLVFVASKLNSSNVKEGWGTPSLKRVQSIEPILHIDLNIQMHSV